MASRPWDKLVAEGREIVKDEGELRFRLGDLALEIAPMGDDAAHNGAMEKLQKFTDEIEFEFEALRSYRNMSAAWPPATRVAGVSWTAHRELVAHEDRFKLLKPGMSSHDARRAAGKKARPGDPSPPVEMRVERVREYLSDPEVAEQIAQDNSTRSVVSKAVAPTARDKAEAVRDYLTDPVVREQVAADDKIGKTVRQASAEATQALTSRVEQRGRTPKPTPTDRYLEITRGLDAGWSHHREVLRKLADVGELPPPLRADALATARDTEETLKVIIEALELGSLTIDDAQLEELLREG